MPDIEAATPYHWLKCSKEAFSLSMLALNEATKRMDSLNPLEDMEEMAYLRKTRDALQKAIKETAFIENIPC